MNDVLNLKKEFIEVKIGARISFQVGKQLNIFSQIIAGTFIPMILNNFKILLYPSMCICYLVAFNLFIKFKVYSLQAQLASLLLLLALLFLCFSVQLSRLCL